MSVLLSVKNIICVDAAGGRVIDQLSFEGRSGENIFIQIPTHGREILFDILCGLKSPDSGEIFVNGSSLYLKKNTSEKQCSIGAVPENMGFIEEMPVIESIMLPLIAAGKNRRDAENIVREIAKQNGLENILYSRPKFLDYFKVKAAGVLRAVTRLPEILVFDDFLSGLNENERKRMWKLINSLRPYASLFIYIGSNKQPEGMGTAAKISII